MNEVKVCFLVILSLMLFQCNSDRLLRYEKDFSTGITVISDNLAFHDYEVQQDHKVLLSNQVQLGSKLTIYFSQIEGFLEVNKRVFPGASLKVTDKSNNIIINQEDLFSNHTQDGILPEDSKYIKLSFQTGIPMKSNMTYVWESTIWDKKSNGMVFLKFLFKISKKK